jgi:predicted amidohydrolase YtcJ
MTEASLWSGGTIFTGRHYAEALLVEEGRVVLAGTLDEARRCAPTGTERRDLGGALIIPGLVDAHLHLSDLARAREGLDLSGAASIEELRDRVHRWATDHPSGPIVGRGWDPERFRERRWPTVRDLDPVADGRIMTLHHASGHAALLSSASLAEAGVWSLQGPGEIDRCIGRFPDGTPNGLLYEEALRSIPTPMREGVPPPPEAIERTLEELAAFGLTAVGAMSMGPEEVATLQTLATGDRLPIAVRGYVRLSEFAYLPSGALDAHDGRFSIIGVKAYLDGAFGPRTAWVGEPYADDPANTGVAVGEESQIAEALGPPGEQGLAPALHAIGDRAIDRAARLLRGWSKRDGPPPRIEHASLTLPPMVRSLEEARPTLVVQPGFVWSDSWLPERLGAERCRWAYPFRTLIDHGLTLAGSSDAPYDPVDPWRGLRAATDRRDGESRSANPDPAEGLSPEEAVGLYTVHAAAAIGEPTRGRLEPDTAADFLVLAVRELAGAIALGRAAVSEVWVGGRRPALRSAGIRG